MLAVQRQCATPTSHKSMVAHNRDHRITDRKKFDNAVASLRDPEL
jgi:hypothetical protein